MTAPKTGPRIHLNWLWDVGGYECLDTDRGVMVATIACNTLGECWEVTLVRVEGVASLPDWAFRDLDGAVALAEAHAWIMDGEIT